MRRVGDYLVYLVVRVLICLVQALRIETGEALARRLAWLFCDVLKLRATVVDDNLAHAFPELSVERRNELSRHMWNHLFLLVLEVAHAPRKIHETNWRRYVSLENADILVRRLLTERPTLIVTAHFGNFEVAGYVLALMGFPTYTVARTLDNPYIDRFLNDFRRATGQHMIPKNGGYDQIAEVLAKGGTMTFLADQFAGKKGCWVEFFGRPASAHKAIALLALGNDATVVVTSAPRVGGPLEIELQTLSTVDPSGVDSQMRTVDDLTRWYTGQFEKMIRRAPQQYWWLHRRWKDPRKPRSNRRKAA
jgi:KDO2-lipid IV(A) lauroyltransferase